MIVKCPQCSTGYNIPDEVFTGKPRKMRCSRCSHVFTLHRRSEAAPAGYEEFTGKQELPAEFAFLREAPVKAQPPLAVPLLPTPALETSDFGPPPHEGLYQRLIEQDRDALATIPLEPPMVSAPPEPPAALPAAAGITPAPVTESEPSPAATQPLHPGVGDIYDSSRSAWEMEAPMEIGGFAIPDEHPGATPAQTAGKVFVVGLLLIAVFMLFVAFRNGWSLSLTELPEQISFALSGAEYEAIPKPARDIEPTVAERHLVQADSKEQYLIVSGTVFNSSSAPRRRILMRGRLLDTSGDIRAETRAPCGRLIDDKVLQATSPAAIDGHYRQDGAYHNCRIKGEGTSVFQLVFVDVPVDYGSGFTVEVKAVAAEVGD